MAVLVAGKALSLVLCEGLVRVRVRVRVKVRVRVRVRVRDTLGLVLSGGLGTVAVRCGAVVSK